MSNRRPNNKLSSIVVYNQKDNEGSWIPLKLSIGDWVTMKPSRKGDHKVKRKYLEDVERHWKGIVKGFKMEGQRKVKEVLVAHVYDKKEIQKDYISKQPNFPQIKANCLCISNWEEWELIESITSRFEVVHSKIGELIYSNKDDKWLKNERVWFYKYNYSLPRSSGECGELHEIPLPTFQSHEWPNIEHTVLSAFRYKLFSEVQVGMKESGGIGVHLRIFMPFLVFRYFFKNEESLRETTKIYMTSSPSEELLSNIFHSGWDTRIHDKHGEEIECRVNHAKISFRYWITRQMLYISFKFRRWRYIRVSGQWNWIPIEQDDDDGTHYPIILVDVLKDGKCFKSLTVEENWTLFDVRQQLELEDVNDFKFFHNGKKVGKRRESLICYKDCALPSKLEIEEC